LISTEFKIGDKVIYPAHGIGTIISEELQKIGTTALEVFVIEFTKEKMTLSIPQRKASEIGLRHLSQKNELNDIYETLKSKAKSSKRMWNRRAQEYEIKINSGNIISLAEVVRDLFKNITDPNRSYSEKVIYESAFYRLLSEVAAVEEIDEKDAEVKLLDLLHAKEAA
jgi:CarD family transcriptional regulator